MTDSEETRQHSRESHGDTYAAVMGPFRTRWAARFTAACGQGNPHIQHVDDAERLCRLYPEYR